MWITELRLDESVDIEAGESHIRVRLTGITRHSCFIEVSGTSHLTVNVEMTSASPVRLNRDIRIHLVKCRKAKVVVGISAPSDVPITKGYNENPTQKQEKAQKRSVS